MTKQVAKKQELSNAAKRAAPEFRISEEGKVTVAIQHEDQIRELYGVKTNNAADGIFTSAMHALGENAGIYRDLMASMAEEMEPTDPLEAMLLSQMTATHIAMTLLSKRTIDADNPQLREGYERSMTRLSRTFIAQMDALKKYRAKAQQTVRVERVTVNEGGQAIVGSVSHGGRAEHEK
jgi:hypothetical protein